MITVNHYVNLIGWKSILEIMEESNDAKNITHKFYCDTVTLKFLSLLFKKKVNHTPGPSIVPKVINSSKSLFLTAYETNLNEEILPIFKSRDDINIFAKRTSIQNSTIVIGISSPTQNYLASQIAESLTHDAEIHCLGAAIYLEEANKKATFYWLKFMIEQPRRTINKTGDTLATFFKVLVKRDEKEQFRKFVGYLE